MNRIILIGRTTKDTEMNQSGKVATNSIAVDRTLKDKDGNKVTDFVNLRWLGDKKAQFAQKYITKGMKIGVTGSLYVDNYKDKDGNNRQAAYVSVDEIDFCESKGNGNTATASERATSSGDGFMNIPHGIDEELPFN